MKYLGIIAALLFNQAMADIPPPPESQRKYTVEITTALSNILFVTSDFQSTKDISLPKEGPFGPCTVQEKSNANGSLTCRSQSSCFYKSGPVCVAVFVAHKDQTPADILKIISADKIK